MDQDGGAVTRRRARPVPELDALRVPPHSVEAEQAVLGGLLLDNTTWDSIADRLGADDFYRRDHQLIFRAVAELSERGEPSDAVTLAEYLANNGLAESTGGLAYLAGLARDTPTAANIRAYADIVRERSQLRQLIRVSGEIAASAYDSEGRSAAELVSEAERRVFEIAESGRRTGSGFVPLHDVLGDAIDRLDLLQQNQGQITGVGTGGHITGCAEVLKEQFPCLKTFAVEPAASPVLSGGPRGPHPLQGIGAGFVPAVLNTGILDDIIQVNHDDAFRYAVRCVKEEGIFIGISSGASLAAVAQKLPEILDGSRVLTFCYDTGERYLSVAGLFD